MTTLTPPEPLTIELVTVPEIAVIGNVQIGTAERWRIRKIFIEPDDHIGGNPVWRVERVAEWLESTNRECDLKYWRELRDRGDFRRKR